MEPGTIIAIVVAAVLVLLIIIIVIAIINTYNALVSMKNTVEEAWSTIDVQLKKRYDLIPNLVETVKGYASHERETLEKVIAARNSAMGASGEARFEAESVLSDALRPIFMLQESYPDLKANTNFMDLQNQLKSLENEIASARRYYNGTVKAFNTKIELFPSNIVAGWMHLTKRQYFEIENDDHREPAQVRFE